MSAKAHTTSSLTPTTTKLPTKPPADSAKPTTTRADAGDISDEVSTSSAASARREHNFAEPQKYPENIHKRVNALRHLYMETRKKEHDMQIALFKKEADTYKSLEHVWKKRLAIVTGQHEPTADESKFSLEEGDAAAAVDTVPNDGQIGVPKFWLVVLNYAAHTADMIHPQDVAALEFLRDIRVEYRETPNLGFTVVFDFLPNPYFNNTTLTRSYEYSSTMPAAQLYSSSNLMPTKTTGTKIDWKTGRDMTKRPQTGSNTSGNEKVDSFFDFFEPAIMDLSQIGAALAKGDDQELLENAEQAGVEYEIAIALRSRIIPRALLFYTGEAETDGVDDSEFSDYSDTEDSEGEPDEGDSASEAEEKTESGKGAAK